MWTHTITEKNDGEVVHKREDKYITTETTAEKSNLLLMRKKVKMIKQGICCLIVLMTFGSCGNNSDEIYTGINDSRYIDILIEKEKHRTLVLEERIDHLTNALMLVSHQFSDSLINFQNDSKQFKPTVSLIQEYNKTCDKKLIESMRVEFKRLKEYLKTFESVCSEQVKILDDFSFEQTLSFFSKTSDSTLCRYVAIDLSNDFLAQKLEIVSFKYDSLLYVLKDSINLNKMNPYEKSVIISEEVQ